MKVTIDLGKLLDYFDEHSHSYNLSDDNGFRAFMLDFLCGEMKEMSTETNYQYRRRPIFNDILFKSYDSAAQVLEKMKERANTRGLVTIADYYHFANQKLTESIMYNWGWKDTKGAYVYSYSDHGETTYSIHFPDAIPIEHYD